MNRMVGKVVVCAVAFSVISVACSKSSSSTSTRSSPAGSTSTSPAVPSGPTGSAAPVPTATTIQLPVTYGYYDGHVDTMISTDVTDKAQATSNHINYSPALATRPANTFPSLYMVQGTAAPNQPVVFGSEPGESDYSPIWQEIQVKWNAGKTPVLLVKDDQIKELASKGQLTMTATPVLLNCPIVKVSSSKKIPTATTIQLPVTYGYYDGHVDTMISTDVTDKAQATSNHINYSPALATRPANTFPSLYMVQGTAAPNQPVVFGSEPGESDYSPIWQEIQVKWNAGKTPVLLVKDDQIKELASKGQLTMTATPVLLNCPIVKVG
jgi:hypothetical protein